MNSSPQFTLLVNYCSDFSSSKGSVTYWLPHEQVTWSMVFRLLEEYKTELNIVDYSVSQTTLEQVMFEIASE